MKILTYIELDIPFCANIYGETPCTAALGVTGDIKCFNTPNTCQDREGYIDDPVTLRFTENKGYLPQDVDAIASIVSINFTPATVSLGKDLGTRASLSVTFKDHRWPDTGPGYDKYLAERGYDPFTRGTYWGKFRARQPFLRGKAIRLIRGELGQSIDDMEVRHFVVDSFTHDTADGTFTIIAKDVLKLADDERSQAPAISSGTISSDIDETDDQVSMSPVGIGNEEYALEGYVALGGKEIVAYKRQDPPGNDSNTKLLLHMDGEPNGTVFVDSSASAHPVTPNGNVQTDALPKFGATAGFFDGSNSFLSMPDHADWTPAGDFTIDFWTRLFIPVAATGTYFNHGTDANNLYELTVSTTRVLTFRVLSGGSTIVTMASAAGAIPNAQPHHIAVVLQRSINRWDIYVDGVSVANVTDNSTIPNFTGTFRLGTDQGGGDDLFAYIDEFRFNHNAVWTGAFTPPDMPYMNSSDDLYITGRAQLGTVAQSHSIGDRVQNILQYDAEDAADIIYDLLVNYAGVDPSFITLANWQAETDAFLSRVFSAIIAEPTGVKTLISELIEDAALSLWWDDLNQQIRLRVLRAISTDAAVFDQGTYLANSLSSREQPNTRVSQIWRYFGKRNPLEGQQDPDNYRSIAVSVDLQTETDYGSPIIYKIYSRWTPFGGLSIAERANDLYLSRFKNPPRRFNFATFRDGILLPELGQGYLIEALGVQDATGDVDRAPIQITRLNPTDATFEIEVEEMLVGDPLDLTNRVIAIDSDSLNINLRELHDDLYPEPTDDDISAGVTLTCLIVAGIVVGSDDADTPALDIGDWPVGFPITLVVTGRIQGAGGHGGEQAGVKNGHDGGTALYTRVDIDLDVDEGEIWGGGGGGGAGSWTLPISSPAPTPSSGGGGGAGYQGGEGGAGLHLGNGAGTASGQSGQPGTRLNGGAGGTIGFDGGAGGAPGSAGSAGQAGGVNGAGTGGAAGNSIDGVSFVTVIEGPGDVLGPQIN